MAEPQTAPEFNSCAHLMQNGAFAEANKKYEELLAAGQDPFAYMMKMQHDLQVALFKKNPVTQNVDALNTLGERYEWLRDAKVAFDDEFREIVDAMPGMNTPSKDRSALWKKWKAKYNEIRAKTFDDLTEDELVELKMELCDTFHFYMNMFFALDMSAREMFVYYYHKNAENFRRCNSGY